jgi:uncharacterized protein DUF4845
MRFHQRGATVLGMVIIVGIVGFALYAGIRLVPLYLEYMAVARALDQTAKEHQGEPTSPQELRTSLNRRWTVEDITSVEPNEIDIKKVGKGFRMRANYEAVTPFIGNLSLLASFDKTVDVSAGDASQ